MSSKTTRRIPSYIGGFFAIIAGLFFVIYPEIASGVIGILFGVVLFVAGISEVIGYILSIKQFRKENYGKAAGAEIVLVYSIVIMALGVFFMVRPETVLMLLSTVVGLFFLIDGIVKLRREIFTFKLKNPNCWVLIILAVLLIVAGILLLINPFNGTRNVIVFSGLAFIVSGVENCCLSLMRREDNKTKTRKE